MHNLMADFHKDQWKKGEAYWTVHFSWKQEHRKVRQYTPFYQFRVPTVVRATISRERQLALSWRRVDVQAGLSASRLGSLKRQRRCFIMETITKNDNL